MTMTATPSISSKKPATKASTSLINTISTKMASFIGSVPTAKVPTIGSILVYMASLWWPPVKAEICLMVNWRTFWVANPLHWIVILMMTDALGSRLTWASGSFQVHIRLDMRVDTAGQLCVIGNSKSAKMALIGQPCLITLMIKASMILDPQVLGTWILSRMKNKVGDIFDFNKVGKMLRDKRITCPCPDLNCTVPWLGFVMSLARLPKRLNSNCEGNEDWCERMSWSTWWSVHES